MDSPTMPGALNVSAQSDHGGAQEEESRVVENLTRRGILKLTAGSAAAALLAACGGGTAATNTPAAPKSGPTQVQAEPNITYSAAL